jgi:hypothetical protein
VGRRAAGSAAAGRGRDQGQEQARRDRRAVVVPPLHQRAGVLRHERPAGPGAQLRSGRPGARLRAFPGQGHGPRAGIPGAPLSGPHRGAAADHRAMAAGAGPAGQPGAVPGQAARGRDAARDRGGVRRLRHAAVPPVGLRSGHAVQLPGLGSALQASRRGLLCAGRGVRPRSVRPAGLAGQGPGGTARGAAPDSGGRPRLARGPGSRGCGRCGGHPRRGLAGQPRRAGQAAGRVPGGVLVTGAEPGPAAGAGHGAQPGRARLAAPDVPSAADPPQGERPG